MISSLYQTFDPFYFSYKTIILLIFLLWHIWYVSSDEDVWPILNYLCDNQEDVKQVIKDEIDEKKNIVAMFSSFSLWTILLIVIKTWEDSKLYVINVM